MQRKFGIRKRHRGKNVGGHARRTLRSATPPQPLICRPITLPGDIIRCCQGHDHITLLPTARRFFREVQIATAASSSPSNRDATPPGSRYPVFRRRPRLHESLRRHPRTCVLVKYFKPYPCSTDPQSGPILISTHHLLAAPPRLRRETL